MASILFGYNYDIFISYRQKDNKGGRQGASLYGATQSRESGWVSEFVEALKTELESTFKEDISVYFDINPHDGLLETHDVDESLKEKLKCLIFIPIISRTYCDPKSFAWEHEFKAFIELASKDQFGLKIKLPGGNVASRVLPVRIHDLDTSDIKLCESLLGGVLRGIDFIYKEAGIDKPLSPDDDEKKNLNSTKYRIQIIKVAHSIKEIIFGMKNEPGQVVIEKDRLKEPVIEVRAESNKDVKEKPTKAVKVRFLIPIAAIALLIIAGIIAYPKIFKRDTLERLRAAGERISVAVMPFQNITNDTTFNYWQEGIQENMIFYLSNSTELQVREAEFINNLLRSENITSYASLTPSVASAISSKIDANIFIYGNLQKAGTSTRVNAKLIDPETDIVFKSFQMEVPSGKEINFDIIDTLSMMVRDYLIITILKKENAEFQDITLTSSPIAYKYYLLGKSAYYKRDFDAALNWLNKAISIDSGFTWAMRYIVTAYNEKENPVGILTKTKEWTLKWYSKMDKMPDKEKLWAEYQYSLTFRTPNECLKYLNQLVELDNQNPTVYFSLGFTYSRLKQHDKAILAYEKSLDIYNRFGSKSIWRNNYTSLGYQYQVTGQYKKGRILCKEAEQYYPDDPVLIRLQTILALSEGSNKDSKEFIEKYSSVRKESGATEATITVNLASIYSEAGLLNKAEEFYRKAITLETGNPDNFKYSLAVFLITKDRNVNEGMELLDHLLKVYPQALQAYGPLHVYGLGLYKQGKYREALNTLQKSWDLRMKDARYDHEAYLHLEAAKMAVADHKQNY